MRKRKHEKCIDRASTVKQRILAVIKVIWGIFLCGFALKEAKSFKNRFRLTN